MSNADEKLKKTTAPSREIANANLFSDDIIFSDTEKILFEEDLQETLTTDLEGLMEGNPQKRYTPKKKLNQGGMKAIWEVDDRRTVRKIAMALIQDSRIASKDDIDSFLYEARLTANLQHPNIIPIYDIALDENGNPYFTMKALKGETLGEIIKQLRKGHTDYSKRYTRTRLLGIFLKVCNAIDYAHSKGVIHLDLNPANIIVGDFGDVQVLDWGLSTLMTHLEASINRRKTIGGTPGYMAPEQAQNNPAQLGFPTDVYMLGAILYEILTLHCPIEGYPIKETLQKTVRGDFPNPGKRAPEQRIPAALEAIALKALKTIPDERYPNVPALIHDIHQFQDGFATSAENPTFITHTALLIKRHKMAVSLIGASAATIAIILTNSFASIKQSEQVALDALSALQEKNEYIKATAERVAPDYLDFMTQQEQNYAFAAAEQALDTGLAFDPSLKAAQLQKGKLLLCQQEFSNAWKILSAGDHPSELLQLAEKYKNARAIPATGISQLVRDFQQHGMTEGIPRLFYHLNRAPFDPALHFAAIAESINILNPKVEHLNFSWEATSKGWKIDLSGNPDLADISPLCGLQIQTLDASGIGVPDLRLLTENSLRELRIANTPLNHLPDLDPLTNLRVLDISGTQIRNISNLVKYPKLTQLDMSNINGLSISQHLIWCRQLKLLTVSETFRNDPTIRTLARRGTIIIYTDR